MISRRGFLAALPAIVAGVAIAKALQPKPTGVPWANIETAAPLTKAKLQEAIAMLETIPIRFDAPMRYTIDHSSFGHGVVYNSGA